MDDDVRRPRRLLSFDASQVSLSRLGKALYYSRPQKLEEESESEAKGLPDRSATYEARAPILAMASSLDAKFAALLSKESLDIIKVDDSSQSVVYSMKVRPRYNPTTVRWGPNNQLALGDSGGSICIKILGQSGDIVQPAGQITNLHCSISSVCFSSGHLLLASTSDGTVKLYDLRHTLKKGAISSFSRDGDIAREAQFRPESDTKFAVIYDSGMVQRWDIRNPATADLRLNAHYQGLSLNWHHSSNYLVTGGRDKRIHVWNMTTESRTPEHTIQTASAVARVRWMPGEHSAVNSPIISCGRSPTDFAVSYWDLKRPWTPTHWCEGHSASITDLEAISPTMIWSSSKDKLFIQTDIQNEPKVSDNWSPVVMAWSADDCVAMSFSHLKPAGPPIGQTPPPPPQTPSPAGPPANSPFPRHQSMSYARSQAVSVPTEAPNWNAMSTSSVHATGHGPSTPLNGPNYQSELPKSKSWDRIHPGHNWPREDRHESQGLNAVALPTTVITIPYPAEMEGVFRYYAENYIYSQQPGETLGALCRHNAHVAHNCRRFRTAQMWRIVAAAVDHTEDCFIRSLPPNQQEAARKLFTMDIGETERSESAIIEDTSSGPSPLPTVQAPPGDAFAQWRGSGTTFASDISAASDNSSLSGTPTQATVTAATPTAEANDAGVVTSAALAVAQDTVEFPSSPDDVQEVRSYGKRTGNDPAYPIDIPRNSLPKFGDMTNSLSASLQKEMELKPRSLRASGSLNKAFSFSSQYESVPATFLGTSATSGASTPGIRGGRVSMLRRPIWDRTFSESPISTLRQQYLDMVTKQDKPWDLLPVVRRTIEHCFNDGLSCTSIALSLLFSHLPGLVPKDRMDEAMFSCIEQMRAIRAFVPAAHIMSVTSVWQDNAGQPDTTVDLVCHKCERSLGENASFVETELGKKSVSFWYCMHCRKLLDGCSICNQPVKGLCTTLLRCGHKAHPDCWAQWATDMDECPAGCGEKI